MRTFIFIFLFTSVSLAQLSPKTLQSETSNNTSTSESFRGMSNGNPSLGHISKLPIRSLLYSGATTKIYARVVAFFDQNKKHVDIGYRSDDHDEVRRQIEDMMSRGIDGAVVDWYGTQRPEHAEVPVAFREEAENHPGFTFAISEDQGAIKKCKDTQSCDVTRLLIEDLNYAYNHFENSPAYLQQNGRPVVFFFDVTGPGIDWNQIRASVKGNPLFIHRNAHSFKSPESDGAFAWLDRNTSPDMPYLDDFYRKYFEARSRQPLIFASVFKGFDDRASSWGKGTVIPQNCGQTWLDTFAKINHYFSPSNPLESLEIVTWNDYEEGTEIETGIDDCVEIQPTISGDTLHWDITGNNKAVDHFVVYASPDGRKLTELGEVPASNHDFKLSAESLTPGRYQLFIEAVGKPNVLDKMSPAISWICPQ